MGIRKTLRGEKNMLKNKLWIVALFAALTMAFFGCTDAGNLDDDSGPKKDNFNPIADGAKYLEISQRVNSWDSIDLRAGKAGALDQWTDGAEHTITIYGKTIVGTTGISLGQTDNDWNTNWGWGPAAADGSFKIEATVPWDKLADASNNKRINMPLSVKTFYVYEIVINDGNDDIYKMSEDKDVQGKDNGVTLFPDDQTPTTWLVLAGNPVVKIVEPGAAILETVYVAPRASKDTEFYIDLNDFGTRGTRELPPNDPVTGKLTYTPGATAEAAPLKNDLVLTFTKVDQRAHFKLTPAQVALLTDKNTDGVKVTIDATTTASSPYSFSYAFTDPSAKEKEKGTSEGTSIAKATPATLTFSADKSDKTLSYFTIQLVSTGTADPATAVTITIQSIKVEATFKTFSGTLKVGVDQQTGFYTLYAIYDGPEGGYDLVWTRGKTVVGSGTSYIATFAGEYTLTMSKVGYDDLTADYKLVCPCKSTGGTASQCMCVPADCDCGPCAPKYTETTITLASMFAQGEQGVGTDPYTGTGGGFITAAADIKAIKDAQQSMAGSFLRAVVKNNHDDDENRGGWGVGFVGGVGINGANGPKGNTIDRDIPVSSLTIDNDQIYVNIYNQCVFVEFILFTKTALGYHEQ